MTADPHHPRPARSYPPQATALAFPLGGIGTGNVSLGARGEWRDWEIFNAQGKGTSLPNTFWAVCVQAAGEQPVARVLEGQLAGPHARSHGYHPSTAAGLPRMREVSFRGEYPMAWIDYADPDLPVEVTLEAYTPLVPLDPADSGIPGAVLTFEVRNPGDREVTVSLAGSIANPVGGIRYGQFGNPISVRGGGRNEFRTGGGLSGLCLRSTAIGEEEPDFGEVSLATDHGEVSAKPVWLRGRWHDYLREFWRDFSADGKLDDLGYADPTPAGQLDTGSIAASVIVPAGGREQLRFYLTWHFPNRPASWDNRPTARMARNFYATRFSGAWDVAGYLHRERDRLDAATRDFHRALFGSTLAGPIADTISATIVPVRSPTCFWLDDGGFYGYEGCFDDHGSCAGTCSHVWSYAYTVAHLFPSLERRMRLTEFREQEADGYLPFRSLKVFGEEDLWGTLEIGKRHAGQRMPAAADGQLGTIIRVYREWLLSGDRDWLDQVWPGVKKALDYAQAQWDPRGVGLVTGAQHTTYDIEFHGPNPLCAFYYLAAVRAVAELADVAGEPNLAETCRRTAERGGSEVERALWNGSYYEQRVDDIDEHPYQHATGCLSDQLLGQLHALASGLGHLTPREHVRAALRAIVGHNFRADLSDHVNCQRSFALGDEAGLIQCSWPDGKAPSRPFIYSDEVWTGSEYAVAALLLYEDMADEATTLLAAIRARHDGFRRSPWDEVESGHHYARSMAGWTVLLAASGVHCDLAAGTLRFNPVLTASAEPDRFACAWFAGRAWGIYEQRRERPGGPWTPAVTVLGGDAAGLVVEACGQRWELSS